MGTNVPNRKVFSTSRGHISTSFPNTEGTELFSCTDRSRPVNNIYFSYFKVSQSKIGVCVPIEVVCKQSMLILESIYFLKAH